MVGGHWILESRLVGWLVGCLTSWLVVWLVDCLTSLNFNTDSIEYLYTYTVAL